MDVNVRYTHAAIAMPIDTRRRARGDGLRMASSHRPIARFDFGTIERTSAPISRIGSSHDSGVANAPFGIGSSGVGSMFGRKYDRSSAPAASSRIRTIG